jgi:DNA-binding XRE family transcriptional regulator
VHSHGFRGVPGTRNVTPALPYCSLKLKSSKPEATALGRLVRQLRQKQGLSMDALADLLGVGTSTVRGWECRGRRPSPRLHARLAEVLDLPSAAGTRPPWPGS